jgi:GDP-mannose 6-dehydrogenase
MRVAIFGLGYVGTVTSACLADRGHTVVGVDVQGDKVAALARGESPIVEPGLEELLHRAHRHGLLHAATNPEGAISSADMSIVCVGTPSLPSGRVDLRFIEAVSRQIAGAMRAAPRSHVVVYRSTMTPGSTRQLADACFGDLLETTEICYVPEFLREGSAVADFQQPSLSVVGTVDGAAPRSDLPAQLMGTKAMPLRWEGAELLKHACNYFHALKVSFGNEIGRLAKFTGEDGQQLIDLLASDTVLNISPRYLRPGNPFGGSCLPKDVAALSAFSREAALVLPLLEHTLPSNRAQLDHLVALVMATGARSVGLLGLTFKPGTDDLRGSPMVALAETLLGRGYVLHIHDTDVELNRLVGANAAEAERRMPHLAALLRGSVAEVVTRSEVVVVAHTRATLAELRALATSTQVVIDVNGRRELAALPWQYHGLCW